MMVDDVSEQEYPLGVGAAGKVAPAGAVRVTVGAEKAGPPDPDTEGLTLIWTLVPT